MKKPCEYTAIAYILFINCNCSVTSQLRAKMHLKSPSVKILQLQFVTAYEKGYNICKEISNNYLRKCKKTGRYENCTKRGEGI